MSASNDKIFDFRAMEAFVSAMACGSMTGAARMMGCSQPAITRLIRDLEDAVGFELFHRNGPRIAPTARGLLFHEEVERHMAGMNQIRLRAEAIRDDRESSIDLAATPTMAGGLVGPALARMGKSLPQAINSQTANAEHVVRSLQARTAVFGISAFPLDHAGLDRHVLCTNKVVAVLAENDPSAKEKTISLSIFRDRRLATVGNTYRLRNTIDEALRKANVRYHSEFATNSSLNAVMAARAGLGIALVDPVTAYGIPVDGVVIRPLETDIPYLWGLFTVADRVVSPLMQQFIEAFAKACHEVIPGTRVEAAPFGPVANIFGARDYP